MVFIFEEILSGLSELGLAEGSIRQYTLYFSKMQGFFTERGAPEYSERILDEYWALVTQREIPYSQKYISSLQKSVYIVRKYKVVRGSVPQLPHLHPHLMRHSRAQNLYSAGMPLPLVSEWLGHSDMEVTLV
jgi:hypothetical protein